MNLGGAQVELELNHTRPGNERQRQGAEGEWGGVAALESGVRSGLNPVSKKGKAPSGEFQKGEHLTQSCLASL